jgi:hypothetical protein
VRRRSVQDKDHLVIVEVGSFAKLQTRSRMWSRSNSVNPFATRVPVKKRFDCVCNDVSQHLIDLDTTPD